MGHANFTDVLIVGHYCHDTLLLPHGTFETLGGSSSYISAAFSSLGRIDFTVAAKVGEDFKYTDKVSVRPIVEKGTTTHFLADMRVSPRLQKLTARCSPITAGDLPYIEAKISLACGVAMEILPETLKALRSKSEHVICDIQGLIRTIDKEGKVCHANLNATPFKACLDQITVLKASEEESHFLDVNDVRQKTTLLITEGPRGCRLLTRDSDTLIPTTPVREIDSTGAGDCFVAGLTYGLLQNLPIENAIAEGNRFGALAVQCVGVPDFKSLL